MNKPATKPAPDLTVRQKIVPAGAAPRPQTTAANSVFAQAGSKKPRTISVFDPLAIKVTKNKPLPPQVTRGAQSRSQLLLQRLAKGDCAEDLTHAQARTVVAHARKLGIKVASRRLDDVHTGVWRMS
jgi:hypothetical protein